MNNQDNFPEQSGLNDQQNSNELLHQDQDIFDETNDEDIWLEDQAQSAKPWKEQKTIIQSNLEEIQQILASNDDKATIVQSNLVDNILEPNLSNLETKNINFKETIINNNHDLLPLIEGNNLDEDDCEELLEIDAKTTISTDLKALELELPDKNEFDSALVEELVIDDNNTDNWDEFLIQETTGQVEVDLDSVESLEIELSNDDNNNLELDDLLDESEPNNNLELDDLLDESEPNNNLELDDLLDESATNNNLELDDLLDESDSNLSDLDGLLDDSQQNSVVKQTQSNHKSQNTSKLKSNPIKPVSPEPVPVPAQAKTFDQTMRVSVRKLDNLNNLIGELVVKRNRLEEDQERIRRFMDNLLGHVQSLGEMGSKMHDLYERSLLEGALIASRQQSQSASGSRRTSSFLDEEEQGQNNNDLDALELDRFTGFHLLSQDIIELIVRVREAASDIQFVVDETDKVTQSLRQVTSQLQDGMNSSRMVPFGQTTDRLPRAIRDISRKLQKQVDLQVEGKEVLIDKMIVENLYNPMTHLVNNAITHGIESPEERAKIGKSVTGTINIRAFLQGNQTVIAISDDGAGIDPERVKTKAVEKGLLTWAQAQSLSKQEVFELIFHAGFSTKDQADDFAGRGVGMDVVSTDLKKIRGTISIESEIGKGTIFTIRLPLVLSICKAISCVFDNTRIAFPLDGVEAQKEYLMSEIKTNENGVKQIPWNNLLLPFQPLSNLLSYNRQVNRGGVYNLNKDEDSISIIILRSADNLLAVEVDQIIGEQEIVIKQIEGPVPKPAGIAGATVMGDGVIMPIGDVLELIEIAQGKRTIDFGLNVWQQKQEQQKLEANNTEPTVLVVDDSITVRELLTLSFNKLGYRVEQARDGQEGWDKLRAGLPCDMIFCDIEMPRMNGLELLSNLKQDEKLQKIPVAMLTSRGADKHRQLATDLGAKAYLTKPYTEKDLMDVAQRLIAINRANKESELMVVNPKETLTKATAGSNSNQPKTEPLVLIIDDSVTVRELLSMTFKKAGYRVEQARDGQEAWDKLKDGLDCDLAFCDIEMPRMNGLELLANLQEHQTLSNLPIAMLTSRGAQKMRNIAAQRGAKGYFVKPYVEETLLDAADRMMQGEVLMEQIDLDHLGQDEA